MNKQTSPVLCWFREDLRLSGHAALQAAVTSGRPVLAIYIYDDVNPGDWGYGAASRWWLHHSLLALRESLLKLGGELCLRRGDALQVISELLAETGAEALYFSRAYEPWARCLETRLFDRLHGSIEIKRFPGSLLFEPEQIRTAADDPFKVFTPFWKACLKMPAPANVMSVPEKIEFYSVYPYSETLDSWRLLPQTPDWSGGLAETWRPGEEAAWQVLDNFIHESLTAYAADRDRPDLDATSRLSPHLHFGEIGPRQIWHAVRSWQAAHGAATQGGDSFLRELGWREFCKHLLFHWPDLPTRPFRDSFSAFPWQQDPEKLRAWRRGKTGYPMVDAGMRQLWRTGWMHNRVRMVVASFLVKDLGLHWREGEDWFWDTLVDADLANNAAGWQWVSGCGADAAPYFRIFNPVLQSQKFDPEGRYVKRWVPELSGLPAPMIHEPWRAPHSALQQAGIELGRDYPRPLVDHSIARQQALASYQRIKGKGE